MTKLKIKLFLILCFLSEITVCSKKQVAQTNQLNTKTPTKIRYLARSELITVPKRSLSYCGETLYYCTYWYGKTFQIRIEPLGKSKCLFRVHCISASSACTSSHTETNTYLNPLLPRKKWLRSCVCTLGLEGLLKLEALKAYPRL